MPKKLYKKLHIAVAFSFLALSVFLYTKQAFAGGACYNCGSFVNCLEGDETLQTGWEDCDVDWNGERWVCEVGGSFGWCLIPE